MTTATTTTVLLKALDLELKALLQQDLNRLKMAKQECASNQVTVKKQAA